MKAAHTNSTTGTERNEHHHRPLLKNDIHHPGSRTTNDYRRSKSTNQPPAANGNASTRRHRQRKTEEGTTDSNGNTPIRPQHRRLTALIQISDKDLKRMSTMPQITVAPSIYTAISTTPATHHLPQTTPWSQQRCEHHNAANIDLTHLLPKLASYTASDIRMQQCGAKLEVATTTRQIWQGKSAVSNQRHRNNNGDGASHPTQRHDLQQKTSVTRATQDSEPAVPQQQMQRCHTPNTTKPTIEQ